MRIRPRLQFNLLTKFSLVAFIITAAIAAALGWGIQRYLEASVFEHEAKELAEQTFTILGSNLEPADFAQPLKPSRFAEIDALVRKYFLREHIVRVNIWNQQGLLLYTDQKDLLGRYFPINSNLSKTLAGEITVGASPLNKEKSAGRRGDSAQFVVAYIPLLSMYSPQVLGAYEVHYDRELLHPIITAIRRSTWVGLSLGFLILYGSLFILVRNASKELIYRHEENARLYQEAERHLKNLQALHSIDQAISANHDLHHTLHTVLTQVTGQLQVDAACVLLLRPHTQTLEFAAGRGFRTKGIENSRLQMGEGYAGRAALEHRILNIPNLPKEESKFIRYELLAGEDFISYYAAPLIAKGQVKGVLEVFHREFLHPPREWLDFLEALATQAAIATDNATLFEDLQRSNIELILAYDATIEGWSRAMDLRDKETEGHTRRVAFLTLKLSRAMGISDAELVHIRRGALLHDIGKMAIPDNILFKTGPLDEEESKIVRRHPIHAHEMLAPIAFLRPALDIPHYHHEKWDGSGYPHGLKGEQIPLAARIFAVVDTWDALSSDRPYRSPWPPEQVCTYIQEQSGRHFDPQVVERFLKEQCSASFLLASEIS